MEPAICRGQPPGSPSPRYRAPEIAEGGPPSAEADIYSIGVILYEMLSGRSPTGDRPAPLSDLRPDVSRDLTDAIMGCLERGPDWRPKDLSYLLQVVGTMRNTGAKSTGRPSARAAAEPARVAVNKGAGGGRRVATRGSGSGSASKSNVPLYGLAALLVIGAGAGAWWYLNQGRDTAVSRGPTPTCTDRPDHGAPAAGCRRDANDGGRHCETHRNATAGQGVANPGAGTGGHSDSGPHHAADPGP